MFIAFLLAAIAAPALAAPAFRFNATLGSHMVLQRAPARAAVYGVGAILPDYSESGSSSPAVTVSVFASAAPNTGALRHLYDVAAAVSPGGRWKALLRPAPAGGNVTVVASLRTAAQAARRADPHDRDSRALAPAAATATLTDVTFGDVWLCSGQSNMWLPLLHTFSRNKSVDALQRGQYGNIRGMFSDSQQGAGIAPWSTARAATENAGANASNPDYTLFKFSAACFYFAQALTDHMLADGGAAAAVPLGLVSNAVGGSIIQEWVLNTTIRTACTDDDNSDNPAETDAQKRTAQFQTLFDTNIRPYLGMTLKGWLWYQGENNCHGTMGNSAQRVGYGCMMPALVDLWRTEWSREPNTTDPLAPFGVVTLAAGGSEGGMDIGGMRWSQTANYGVLPNAAMPNTFLAQAFDLGDPFPTKDCYSAACCWNHYQPGRCASWLLGRGLANVSAARPAGGCQAYCDALHGTNYFMGPIHPRDKRPVGARLARAAYHTVYGGARAFTGPTVAGCALEGQGAAVLRVKYNTTLLRGGRVTLKAYNATAALSGFRVLTNASQWCLQSDLCPGQNTRYFCASTGPPRSGNFDAACGAPPSPSPDDGIPGPDPYKASWRKVNASLDAATGDVLLDLAPLGGAAPAAVQYAWHDVSDSCCTTGDKAFDALLGTTHTCAPGSCPVFGSESQLPGNPWIAQLESGRCKCVPPQRCDA